ncbi:MAG: bacterioferritin-associated ferredoxin [Arenicella sp.]|jgi:bacterioferritin-associated ferredoxin
MFVCLCKSVTDRAIEASVDDGVTSFTALQEKLSVATVCGSCSCEVKRILQAKLQRELSARAPLNTIPASPVFTN